MENITFRSIFKRDSLISFAKIFVPAVLFLMMMALYSFFSDFDFGALSRDPLEILWAKPYLGVISRIGVIFWTATSVVLLYSSLLSYKKKQPRSITSFLFWGGLLSAFLLIDDFFMFHDVIFSYYLNIDEKFFYAFYGLSVVALFYFYHKIILDSDYILLLMAIILLGGSVITDIAVFLGLNLTYVYVVEDGLKFLGIIAWFAYFTRTGYKLVKPLS